jgi:hypothetical protein
MQLDDSQLDPVVRHDQAMQSLCRAVIRAGMLRRVAQHAAAAAQQLAEQANAPISLPLLSVAHVCASSCRLAAVAAVLWPELGPEVEAAFAESHALPNTSRLVALLTAIPAHRFDEREKLARLESALHECCEAVSRMLWAPGRTPRSADVVAGWPLHALLLAGLGRLRAADPSTPHYGLPGPVSLAQILALSSAYVQPGNRFHPFMLELPRALAAPDVPLHGFSRRGLVAVALRTGSCAVRQAASAAGGGEQHHITLLAGTAISSLSAVGRLTEGLDLAAEWQRAALADAWRLARDAAAAGVLVGGNNLHFCAGSASVSFREVFWQLLGEVELGERLRASWFQI